MLRRGEIESAATLLEGGSVRLSQVVDRVPSSKEAAVSTLPTDVGVRAAAVLTDYEGCAP